MAFHGYHHITASVTRGRPDMEFHAGLLGLRNVKRTVLLDGDRPFYHLYYGNQLGEPGTLLTSFVFGPERPEGRRGSGQVSSVALSVPSASLPYWSDRLAERGVAATALELLGQQRIRFHHPDESNTSSSASRWMTGCRGPAPMSRPLRRYAACTALPCAPAR